MADPIAVRNPVSEGLTPVTDSTSILLNAAYPPGGGNALPPWYILSAVVAAGFTFPVEATVPAPTPKSAPVTPALNTRGISMCLVSLPCTALPASAIPIASETKNAISVGSFSLGCSLTS